MKLHTYVKVKGRYLNTVANLLICGVK